MRSGAIESFIERNRRFPFLVVVKKFWLGNANDSIAIMCSAHDGFAIISSPIDGRCYDAREDRRFD